MQMPFETEERVRLAAESSPLDRSRLKAGWLGETSRSQLKQAQVGGLGRPALPSEERARMKALEPENHELRTARGTERTDTLRPREAPRILFLPRCGAHGIGEYVRCLILAQALRARHPHAAIELAVPPSLPRLPGDDFARASLARGEGQSDALAEILARLRPHLLVTNNRGRPRELAHARAQGAAVVAIFSTARRSRARRLDVLRQLDQLWIVPGEGRAGARGPSLLTRALAGFPHCEVVETLHPPADPARASALRARLGLDGAPYAFFAPGGGGWRLDGRPASDVFRAAAARVARAGARAVVVAGPLHRGAPAASDGVTWLEGVAPEAMVDLAAGAEVVVCAGGGLLGQVLSLGRPCVTTPMPAADQRQRTDACRAAGTALVVAGMEAALADGALALLVDGARRDALVRRLADVGPRNALPRCVELLEALLRGQRAAPSGRIKGSPKPPIASDAPEGSEAAVDSSSTMSRPA
jgi:hypothetical protein